MDLLAQLHRLEAEREVPAPGTAPPPVIRGEPVVGEHLVIPAEEGVLLAEARALRGVAVAELPRVRPELRFSASAGRFVRDLGPGLGALEFSEFDKYVTGVGLEVAGSPTFADLVERLPPVLAALGGMGPIACALGTLHPAQVREVRPVALAEVAATLVPDSPHGRRVYPCWLLGGPPHTRVGLDLGVEVVDGRPSFGCRAWVSRE